MVTLESGRVKPDDVTTIKLVLDAISHIKSNQYSIIINKLSDGLVSTLNKSEESREELAACLSPPSIGAGTRSIYYVPMKFEWIDQDNKWGELPELLSFMEHAPEVFISSDNIRNIQYSQFEEIVAQLREEIRLLREENEVLRQTMANREKELGKLIWNGPQNTATDTGNKTFSNNTYIYHRICCVHAGTNVFGSPNSSQFTVAVIFATTFYFFPHRHAIFRYLNWRLWKMGKLPISLHQRPWAV